MKAVAALRAIQLPRVAIRLRGVEFVAPLSPISSPQGKSLNLCGRYFSSGEVRHEEVVVGGREVRVGQEWLIKSLDGRGDGSSSWKDCSVQDCSHGYLTGGAGSEKVDDGDEVGEVCSGDEEVEREVDESPELKILWKSKGISGKSGASSFGETARNSRSSFEKKKGKRIVNWVCSNCGHSEGQWWGSCRSCNTVGSLKKYLEDGGDKNEKKISWLPRKADEAQPVRVSDVNRKINQLEWRTAMPGPFGNEVSRVLGGGLVPGSLVLVGGDPGVGKSTLLLQVAGVLAEGLGLGGSAPVVYVSGEESIEQIGNRAHRMEIDTDYLYVYSSTDIEDILEKIQVFSPRALIIDSIQTVYINGVTGSPGGLPQVKECTSELLRFAKKTNVPVFIIGHVTKTGDIAGPKTLEHIVDAVLYMEGEKSTTHRLLRSVKNRFGSTDELGVFEMSRTGLRPVANPSEMFLSEHQSDSDVLAGLTVAAIMDGSRTFLIEIQALCASETMVSRHVNGVPPNRAAMIIAVLTKQAGLKLQSNSIYLNVVGGASLTETAGDLAVAVAICSSAFEIHIPSGVAFIGEIGLGGELRTVPRMENRLNTVAKLGYKKCFIPKSAKNSLGILDLNGMQIVGCSTLKEVIREVFEDD